MFSGLKLRKPSAAMLVALVALFVALSGGAYAATQINGKSIKKGSLPGSALARKAVSNGKLADRSVSIAKLNAAVRSALAKKGATGSRGAPGPRGATGPQGPKGDTGATGAPGTNGRDGANPATPVVNVPPVTAIGGAGGPDSGQAGDQGFYLTGLDASGSASLARGALQLHSAVVDASTPQGGIGIAKAFNNVPLGNLDALSFEWRVNALNGGQAPTIHVTVTGLTANSRFASGFANVTYNPALNHVTVGESQDFMSDGFATGALWYSTTNPDISAPGGQNSPQSLQAFVTANPNAVIDQISVDNGGSSGGTGTFDASADNLILGFTGSPFTRYDFGG
jgi:Collagen triple helix repeat (20 copies)